MKERPDANTVCYCRNWRLRITGKYFYTSIYFRINKLNPSWFKVLSVLLNPLALNLTLLNLAGKALQCTLHWVEDAICKLITDIIGHFDNYLVTEFVSNANLPTSKINRLEEVSLFSNVKAVFRGCYLVDDKNSILPFNVAVLFSQQCKRISSSCLLKTIVWKCWGQLPADPHSKVTNKLRTNLGRVPALSSHMWNGNFNSL